MASDDIKKKILLEWLRAADAERARREGGPRASETMLKRSAALLAEISPLPAPFLPAFPYGPLVDVGPGRVGNVPAGASGRAETNRPEERGGGGPGRGETREHPPARPGYTRDRDKDDPRDEPPPVIYGEDIEIEIQRPLIFVPGIMGSALSLPMAAGPHLPIWPPRDFKVSSGLQQLSHNSSKVPTGLFPGTYTELLSWLDRMGYKLNINFWVYAYDWTQSNRDSGNGLATLIEGILGSHPEWESVDIINHSMGGLVTRQAYRVVPAKIKRVIYLASPHYGAPKAYFVLRPGIGTFGGGATGFFKKLVAETVWDTAFKDEGDEDELEDTLKRLAGQLQSVYELLPDDFYLDPQHVMATVEEGQWVQLGAGVTYQFTVRSVTGPSPTYFDDVCALPAAHQPHVRNALAFKRELGGHIPPGGPEHTLLIYASKLPTYDTIEKNDHFFSDDFEDPIDSGQAGDETVPTDSARANLGHGDARVKRVQAGHSVLPDNPATLAWIHQFLAQEV